MTAATAVIVIAGAGSAWGLTRGSGASYRTAVASNATVMQTLAAIGTVSPVSHAAESFQVSGTVAHVKVKTGQTVRAGQVLAQLNRAELSGALKAARSTLASARNRMSADETGQSVSSTPASSGGSTPTFQAAKPHVVLTPPPTAASGGNAPTGGLAAAQASVRDAQQATDQDLSLASQALQAADLACTPSQTAPSADDSPTPDPTASSTPAPTDTASSGDACTTAGAALLAAQQAVDRDEQQVSDAETALTKILAAMSSSGAKSPTASDGSTTPQSQSHDSTTVSAADIALDQASIDQALSVVDTDLASLDQGTLRATIAGRVAAVTVSRGDQVTASSTSPAVVIVGSQQEQTTIDLSATEIREVKVGLMATVVADSSSKHLTGRVVSVNAAGTESSSGSVTFPVTIALPSGTDVVAGAAASVTLVITSVDDVLSVPTSAVHHSGTTAYVQVLRAGKLTRWTVKVGAVGAALTQIDSGLTAGDRVVLADLNASVPSSSSNTSSTFGGGSFTFPGGGGAFSPRFAGNGTGQTGTVTFGGPGG